MDQQILRMKLRQRMEERLKEWIPHNQELREKEMRLFDHLMSRRDFLKISSVVTASLLLNNGCGHHDFDSPPSQWDDGDNGFNDDGQINEKKASKILVDADVMDGMQSYHPLKAAGSKDAPEIKNSAILESFNPHIMTVASNDTFAQSGFNPLNRNYGIPEYIHLNKESDSTDYYLNIYEKHNTGHHGLKEHTIKLEGTASFHIDSLITANGNFHNQVLQQVAYSQKLILLADTHNTVNPALRLYYQVGSSPLLQPGVTQKENAGWSHLDLFDLFQQHEKHGFQKHSVVEVNAYNDGSQHNFIYGTIQFDDLYNYGFIVTFNDITDTEPSITFFAPEFLSIKSSMIQALEKNFNDAMEDADLSSDSQFMDFSIFSNQKFVPFAQLKDTTGNTQSNVLFSFLCFNSASDPDKGEVDVDDDTVDLDHFCNTDSAMNSRYLLSVDTSHGGIVYPLSAYSITPSITIEDDAFILDFNTSKIPTIDIWKSIYTPSGEQKNQSTVQFQHTFVRSIENDGKQLHLLMSTSFYDGNDLGMTHKSVKIDYDISGNELHDFSLHELYSADAKFETTLHKGKGYKELWFNDMKLDDSYSTLANYVHKNNGVYDFYCTHTHQGLLRGYYVVSITDDHRFLIGFNEKGENPDAQNGKLYDYQTHDSLYQDIVSDALTYYPPLPIALNPDRMFRWHKVAHESEVLYTSPRTYLVNETKRTLEPNDGSQKLLSYNHATADPLEGIWTTHEQEKQIPASESSAHQYKVTSHHVHLHINNIYGYSTVLEENTYVELRFSKPLIVTDHTDVNNPMTYHVGRLSSIFLKPDTSGRIALDIKAGANKNDIFKGATMVYRFLDTSDLDIKENEPVAVLSGTSGNTTEFQQCNISFKQFARLSSKNASAVQPGAPESTKTAETLFHENVMEGQKDTITTFTDAYAKLYQNAQPDNDAAPNKLSGSYMQTAALKDPLVFVASFHTEELRDLGSVWDKVVDWTDKAMHTIANVVNSAVHLAKELAKAIKKAVGKLVDDIATIVSKIGASLANIIVQIGAAFEKILNIIITLAELVWELIKALFDMDSAWKIGHELRQLFYDQFRPSTTLKTNTYSILKNQTKTIQNTIDTITKDVQKQIDHAIDTALGYDLDNDPSTDANKQIKENQKNSTKYHYLNDQVERLSASHGISSSDFEKMFSSYPLAASSSTDCDSSDTVEELLVCISSKMSQTFLSDIDATVTKSMDTITALLKGKTWNETKGSLDAVLKDSAKLVTDEMDILSKGVMQLPMALLNGSSLFDMLDNALNDILKPVFELLGILLFQDKDKFKSLGDIGFFAIGFFINMISVFLKDILSAAHEHLDIAGYIKSGEYRSQVNALGGGTDTQEVLSATPSLIPVSYEINRIVRTSYKRGCPQGKLGKIWNMIAPVVLSSLRTPHLIDHTQKRDILGICADTIFIVAQIVNSMRLYRKNLETNTWQAITILYVWLMILTNIFDLIEAALNSKTTSEKIILTEKSISQLQAVNTAVIEIALIADKELCVIGNVNTFLSIAGIALAAANYLEASNIQVQRI